MVSPSLRLKRLWQRCLPAPRLLPWVVLIAGFLITSLAVVNQQRYTRIERERLQRVLADDISAALRARLATNQAILAAVVGLFGASEDVTEAEFARFYRSLTVNNANLAGIQGVGYTARIPPGEVEVFEQRIRRQGQPDFRIQPPGRRRLMSAIVYLEPADWRNERAMGFDMASEPTRRRAMEQAAFSGDAVLSGPLRLRQETDDHPQVGALLYAPIYAGDQEFRSPDERWQRLRGWAYITMRMGDLVASVLDTVTNPDRSDAAVLLFDGDRPLPQKLLFESHGLVSRSDDAVSAETPASVSNDRLQATTWVPLRLANHSWLLGVRFEQSGPDLGGAGRHLLLSALLGVCLSALAALLTARLVANHLALRHGLEREAQAARERALAAAVFETTPVGIVVTDPNGMILRVNQAFTGISGYSQLEARGHKANLLRSGRHDNAFYEDMWTSIVQRGHWSGEIWNRHRNGTIRRHELNITAVLDGQEQIVYFVGLLWDVSERYAQERRMRHLATHDPLTGLANRTLLMEELQRALALARRRREGVAVLFVDLNGFKAVNDRHGHSIGDALLKGVAQRLQRQVRASDLVCRQGGDEFVLMISEAPDDGCLRDLAIKLINCLEPPYPDLPGDVRISASVGVARWPDHAEDADGLLNAADNAMYAAKQRSGEPPAIAVAQPSNHPAVAVRGTGIQVDADPSPERLDGPPLDESGP